MVFFKLVNELSHFCALALSRTFSSLFAYLLLNLFQLVLMLLDEPESLVLFLAIILLFETRCLLIVLLCDVIDVFLQAL